MAGWKSSWNSLVVRLMLSFVLYVVAVTAVFTISPYTFVRDTLTDGLAGRGEARLKMVQGPVSGYLSLGMINSVQSHIAEVPKELPEISYVALADAKGVFLAHSDPTQVEKPWSGKGVVPQGAGGATRQGTTYRGERILEVAAPILVEGKPAGTMIIGLNYREVDNILGKLMRRLALIGFLVLAVSMMSTRPFTTRIISGLTRLGEMTREVVRGELREKVPEEGFEEIRTLARDFNAMAEHLRAVLGQIQETSASVGTFSSDFMTVIQDQAASASQQATSVAEVTATMEELSRTSRQIAQNAESVKKAASKSVEVAQAGTTLGREGVEAMAQIKERVGDIARKTLFLGEKSHEIGKVMEIIKEIATEIHLLALNAAIESAAAGEHGRRFAVVASEVRRLAEKTRESTETIRGIITEIQSATNSSVEATEQGTREVERWKETIRLSSDAFSEIIETIERTSEASTQISLATHQQTSANEQVVQAMRQIEEMVRVTATKMKESTASASRLREMAATLQEKTAVFRV
jgi:methyl-accepting chemotaxis protein